ncbi:lactate utilization protein C (plasmid) [Vibrio alginolyticus]|uniref:LutC/YkgG family protein n=1 Tax=Vibrio alginolyticus TaxID=663 RepID=UPI000CE9877C|nr:lactate utilization protein C [Vibrio alginolyticus]AVF73829.1 lactate utilization protein C [Vibrio alginolyticus]MBM5276568.1 lactate utilization protein C [Vibrio parahaemolyticus]MCF9039488.1 lactate utilization protein C [Vibrio parahaemolyticus]
MSNTVNREQRLHNRSDFLANIAQQLGRDKPLNQVERPALRHTCHKEVMANFAQDDLKNELVRYTETSLGAKAVVTTKAELENALKQVCFDYCQDEQGNTLAGETIISASPALLELVSPSALANDEHHVHVWDYAAGFAANIAIAERAKVGIVWAEQALAESGTMVLYSQVNQGRAVSLLPEASVFVVAKSHLMPRLTQATALLHQKASQGERVPSCVNFISGPSSTADIELIKVVGVHGPVFATYVIIDDM